MLGCSLFLVGCDEVLPTGYAKWMQGTSVNGNTIFQTLMRSDPSFTVTTRDEVTPRLQERGDCFLWFPDRLISPSEREIEWFEDWLTEKDDRVMVYVGRSYDAAESYWSQAIPMIPAQRQNVRSEMEYRRAQDRIYYDSLLKGVPKEEINPWYTSLPSGRPIGDPIAQNYLRGSQEWTKGLLPKDLHVVADRKMIPPLDAEVLLALDGEVIVSRVSYQTFEGGKSHLILVSNGSFLLNLPLVNSTNRELATRLLDEIERLRKDQPTTAVFLESGAGGLTIRDRSTPPEVQQSWSFFSEPPLDLIFMQIALVGIFFIFSRWPIFGRPRKEEEASLTDFGRHVKAIGDLLRRAEKTGYAQQRLYHYRQTFHKDREFEPLPTEDSDEPAIPDPLPKQPKREPSPFDRVQIPGDEEEELWRKS
ncbi:Hypothetical protein PBC10988_40070 [Planctomycetales bacterium 10988]|nr:Hypothetical protein PBC10988_40070 [Planctomycetales bacterium 10988]